ncbi:MAG TPA: GGDEF domain-containing response regulator [Candidatus Tenderia sp.]|nr:GGDEF domain-containing response regulator [Candidatus Tenderia sp.]
MTPFDSPGQPQRIDILVVDDEPITRTLIKAHLEKAGYGVIEATDGETGLAQYDQHTPTLVLLDVMMPVMNGYDTCVELRKRISDQSLPILMLTGLNEMNAIERAFQSGATDFITKPLNWPILTQRIRYALRDRRQFLELQEKQHLLSEAQRIAKMGYLYIDVSNWQITLSAEVAEIIGIPHHNEIDLNQLQTLLTEPDCQRLLQNINQAIRNNGQYLLDHKLRLPNGQEKVILQRGEMRQEHGRRVIYATLQDITEQAKAEERLLYHSYYDVLTNLPNRKLFESNIMEQIDKQTACAVMFIGIDRFKAINDSLGHRNGDKVLKEIANRITPYQQQGYRVARFSGDTFAILLPNTDTNQHQADDLAQEILSLMEVPLEAQGHELVLHGSIGIALYPQEADTLDKLLLGADIAMNLAKGNGGNQYRYFSTTMDTDAQQRLALEEDLRKALRNGEFELYYQPQYNARSRKIVGVEALIRWHHPTQGMIPPALFIPLAEETGLVTQLGEWVLYTAAQQGVHWHKAGHAIRLGVNLSAKQLALSHFQDLVQDVLRHTKISPALLELEITESMAVSDFDNTIQTLDQIRSLDVKISMDDFGTGYSSLSYLQQLPLNTLKIDRAFIKDITADGRNGEIAKAIIAMSKSLNLHIIAEGIETAGQYDYLRHHGADEIQGFYFSKPLPVSAFNKLLR